MILSLQSLSEKVRKVEFIVREKRRERENQEGESRRKKRSSLTGWRENKVRERRGREREETLRKEIERNRSKRFP